RRAYGLPGNPLRASIVSDPAGQRRNTFDNTPAVTHIRLVPGDKVAIRISAKGGGSENKAQLGMLNPSDSVVDWVLSRVEEMGAGWCPPGVLGIGIGGTAEKAMLLAKEALLDGIDMPTLKEQGPKNHIEALRIEIYDKVNALGIGAQGLGGLTTVLDVKIQDYPTHAASLPVAVIPNCAATRHVHFTLDGSGPAILEPPRLADWPQVDWSPDPQARQIDLSTVSRKEVETWRPGETLLLTGKLLTGRDAAHRRIAELLEQGKPLPAELDFTNRFIYYVGPVDPINDEPVGPAGPTTATRMDKFTDTMLAQTGLLGMIGKAERGEEAVKAIQRHRSVYLIAVGGAAYLVAKSIKSARVLGFPDLCMEAEYVVEVDDMPMAVAAASSGESV